MVLNFPDGTKGHLWHGHFVDTILFRCVSLFLTVPVADEENNEVENMVKSGIPVKDEEQEWYQPDIEDFFDHQEEEPDHQMDKEQAEELLGFLSGGQETTGEVFCAGDEDILLEEMMREECEERPLLETAREAVAQSVVESSVDISIINEFNLLD